MSKYVAIVAVPDIWGRTTTLMSEWIYVPEPQLPRKTGLVNAQGIPLYRLPEPEQPLGFDLTPSEKVVE